MNVFPNRLILIWSMVMLGFFSQGCNRPTLPLLSSSNNSPRDVGRMAFSALPLGASGRVLFVAPSGSSSGDGSISNPWDIDTAFNLTSTIRPGDTLYLRAGKYGGGQYNSVISNHLVGTSSAPIIIKNYPGEQAIIDAWLQVGCCDKNPQPSQGAYVWFWGLEFASYNTNRTSGTSGPPEWAFMYNHEAVDDWAPGSKFINNLIHDTAGGLNLWAEALDAEAFGNIIYNIGGQGTDRGHGHGFYLQNNTGVKHIRDNIVFNIFDMGLQAYGSADSAYVRNFDVDGNAIFNSGAIGTARTDNLIFSNGIGGPSGISVTNNILYHPPSVTSEGYDEFGWTWSTSNADIVSRGNYFIGGLDTIDIWKWNNITFQNNFVYGNNHGLSLFMPSGISTSSYNWNNNSYYGTGTFGFNSSYMNFSSWRSATGLDSSSSATTSAPTGVKVIVRPNKFETGRANIYILNWDMQSSVSVDLGGSGLTSGQTFEIRDAQNFAAGSIASGTYNGSPISIRMAGLSAVQPNGSVPRAAVDTAPLFGTFIVLPMSGAASSTPVPTATATPASTPTATPIATATPVPVSSGSFPSGLSARFSFDNLSGSTVTDDSGHGITGSLSGSVQSVAGFSGQGLNFGGSSGQVIFGQSSSLIFNSSVTVSAFIKTTNNIRPEGIISNYDASGSERGYILSTTSSGHLALRLGGQSLTTGSGRTLSDTGPVVNDGRWHHVAAVITMGQGVQFYIDGHSSSQQTAPVKATSIASTLRVGVADWFDYGNFFTGSIDEVEIYTRALSSTEIAQIATLSASSPSTPVMSPTPVSAPVSTPVATATSTPAPTPAPVVSAGAIRINCGGSDFVAADGTSWSGDRYYTGGQLAYTGYLINGTSDLYLYRTGREGLYDDFSYSIPVANGTHQVTLRFAETTYSSPGQRVFNVTANGSTLLSKFDILTQTQPLTVLSKTFTVQVSSGVVNLNFIGVVGRALISTIEIQ